MLCMDDFFLRKKSSIHNIFYKLTPGIEKLRPDEGQQIFVELLLVCAHQAMGRAWIDL